MENTNKAKIESLINEFLGKKEELIEIELAMQEIKEELLKEMESSGIEEYRTPIEDKAIIMNYDKYILNKEKSEQVVGQLHSGKLKPTEVEIKDLKKKTPIKFLLIKGAK